MKFSSRKSMFSSFLILGSAAFLILFPVFGIPFGWIEQPDFWMIIPCLVIAIFLLWLYFGTHYQLTDTELIYRSGPFRGKIQISEVQEIVKGKTLYAGMKPATATKGLIVKYNKYDEIYWKWGIVFLYSVILLLSVARL